ncbi:MAG: glycoside hydrolase family 38 C-terminal domain-containing protein [Candidatus Kryptoniota bacterium]
MKKIATPILTVLIISSTLVYAQNYDLSTQKALYAVGYAHLDTQWRWDYPTTIDEFIWNTMEDNFPLFQKYPDYIFNFTGANRYMFMKEYYPAQYDSVIMYVAEGKWFPAGSSMEENDVLSPSAESDIRQVLYGNDFFRKEFGVASNEFMLPDCFGFPASLPSALAHCGIKGFSTQKLTWGSAVGIPFNVGRWIGPDGKSIVAAFNPGSYGTDITSDLGQDTMWIDRINKLGRESGVYTDYMYYGTGDMGGSPTEGSVQWLEKSIRDTSNIRVVSAKADAMFNDITPDEKAKLPSYKGELLLTNHSAGSINSAAYMKRWNRKNEFLAYDAEASSVMGSWLGGMKYDQRKMNQAWRLVLASQFHDMLPGTVIPEAFDYEWNDELVAANQFSNIFANASGTVVRTMDTRGKGVPIVVFNPLPFEREDVVNATVTFDTIPPRAVRVFDHQGNEVPSQMQSVDRNKVTVIFLAKASSLSYSTFDVRTSKYPCALSTRLKVTASTLENAKYLVKIDSSGDVESIYDKTVKKELLSSPIRLAFLHERPEQWPAWNMDWADRKAPPEGYVDGPAKITIVENGPVRVGIQVEREARHSKFVQEIRLSAGDAGDRVEFNTKVDWATQEASLEATLPLTVSNPLATYNCDVGTVQRGDNDSVKFEVPSHQWFDLTDKDGKYGVSILEDCKNGSDKPADNILRLTLLYTPGVHNDYKDQAFQDIGKHQMLYAVYGHNGDWREGNSNLVGFRVNQPLVAFQVVHHNGFVGKSFSFLKINNPNIDVMALKKSENNDDIILRIVEAKGKEWKNIEVSFASPIIVAKEVDGQERDIKQAGVKNGKLVFDETPYQLRTFELRLRQPRKSLPLPRCTTVQLPYNVDAMSYDKNMSDGDFDGEGRTYPAEMLPDTIISEDINFVLGPKADGKDNTVACDGQRVELPNGKFNRIYILAASTDTLADGIFKVADKSIDIPVQPWSGFLGQWDKRIWDRKDTAEWNYTWRGINYLGIKPGYVREDNVGFYATHRHLRDGKNDAYAYAYMYKYKIDLPEGTKEIVLPSNKKVRIFAMTAAYNENDNTVPAQALFNTLNHKHGYERFMATAMPQVSPGIGYIDYNKPLTVTVSDADDGAEIHYTLDGATPTMESPQYTSPLSLDRTFVLNVRAFDKAKMPSPISTGYFSKSLPIMNIKYLEPYSMEVPGDKGDKTLISLHERTSDFDEDAWQGFQKNNLNVILDLGQVRTLDSLTLECLQANYEGAFLPDSVEVAISSDSVNYQIVVNKSLALPERHQRFSIKELSYDMKGTKGRYVHIIAKNIGELPKWSRNAGKDAWMLFDEITVR